MAGQDDKPLNDNEADGRLRLRWTCLERHAELPRQRMLHYARPGEPFTCCRVR
jgi:hypothetical protein